MTDLRYSDPDGYVVIHHPPDGADAYCIGPFPPIRELIDMVVTKGICDCRREAMPVAFPRGVVMVMSAEDFLAGALIPTDDRLN